jgi:hypothetical protein
MMWRKEHLWNLSVLQRVHLSNLVLCESRGRHVQIFTHSYRPVFLGLIGVPRLPIISESVNSQAVQPHYD